MSGKARTTTPAATAAGLLLLGSLLGACTSGTSSAAPSASGGATVTGTAPVPATSSGTSAGAIAGSGTASTTGATSTSSAPDAPDTSDTPGGPNAAPSPSAGGPTGPASQLLRSDQLPDAKNYSWSSKGVTQVDVEHPLPDLCGNPLGTQVTHGVWEGDFGAHDSSAFAAEDIYVYASPADAAAQIAASRPKCPGTTVSTATGFAWSGPGRSGVSHILFTIWKNEIAALVVNPGRNDYNPSLDAQVLTTMTQRLESP